jgi:hypothetical protein
VSGGQLSPLADPHRTVEDIDHATTNNSGVTSPRERPAKEPRSHWTLANDCFRGACPIGGDFCRSVRGTRTETRSPTPDSPQLSRHPGHIDIPPGQSETQNDTLSRTRAVSGLLHHSFGLSNIDQIAAQ